MDVKFLNQPKEIKLGDVLKQRLKEDFDSIYLIAGMLKDTGIDEIYEDIKNAINDSKTVNIYMGIDRKNTSKDMLLKLISIGCSLSVHINTDDNKVESRAYVFEKKDGASYIYVTGAKFSAGGLFENTSIVTEIKYSKEDKKAFEIAKNNILQGATANFHQIDQDEIILLAEKGEIVARITDRKIPKITEMYGSSEQTIGELVYDESTSASKINLADIADIDIDFDPGIAVRKNVELEAEKEAKREQAERKAVLQNLKKTEEDLEKLYGNSVKEEKENKKPTIHMSDEVDFENMTTLIIESNKIIEKGVGAGEFKIPKALSEKIMNFLEPSANVQFDIVDNRDNGSQKDEKVEIICTDKGISIKSPVLIDLKPEEGDIVRIIKDSTNQYKCELIRKETEEYKIWSCYLLNSIKGNKRKYGVV